MQELNDGAGSSVQESLHEIASLLLMVHDFYLSQVTGSDIILALTTFIHDINLHQKVSILDVERCRRKVMGRALSYIMGYELFYDW